MEFTFPYKPPAAQIRVLHRDILFLEAPVNEEP